MGNIQAFQDSYGGGQACASLLAGFTDFSITYKQAGFKLAGFSDASWGSNPD